MANTILLVKEFDPAHISYGEVKTLTTGAKSAYISYDGHPLLLQLPWMNIPFAINEEGYKGAALTKYDLQVSFRGRQTDPRLQLLYQKLGQLEAQLVRDGVANSLSWFKKKGATDEYVEDKLSRIIKHSKDKSTGEVDDKYDPTLRVKLPYNFETQTFTFPAYDLEGNDLKFGDIKANVRGGRARLIVQFTGVWFSGNGGFGVSWKVYQGQFDPRANAPKGLQFRKDEDDDAPAAAAHDAEADADLADDAAVEEDAVETVETVETVEETTEEDDEDAEAERLAAEAALAAAAAAARKAAAAKKPVVKKPAAK